MTAGARRLRVFMTVDAVGGVWSYATTLAECLARGDHSRPVEFLLAGMGPPPSPDQRAAAEALRGVRIVHRPYRLEWMEAPWEDVARAGRWLLAEAEAFQPDVVHLNGYAHAALDWRVPVLVMGHSCVLSWWEAVHREPAPPTWQSYRGAVARGLGRARCVVAPTGAMLAALDRHYGLPDDRRVIANGCFLERFTPGVKEPIVVAAGRLWDEAKNLAALEAAAPHLPWPVYVAGDDRHPDGGQAVPTATKPLGRLAAAALAGWLGRAMVYALPARYEPFGLSALEAAAAGCVLVLGDIPSLREVWGDAAVFVDPDEPVALAAVISGLTRDAARREALAARAGQRARLLTAERMAAQYADLYEELVATHPRPSAWAPSASQS